MQKFSQNYNSSDININFVKKSSLSLYGLLIKFFYIILVIYNIGIEFYTHHFLIALKVLPLLILIRGIFKANIYILQWYLIILHLYLFEAIVSLTSSSFPFNIYGA